MTDLDDIEAKLTDAEASRLYFHWMLERSLDDIEQVTNELVAKASRTLPLRPAGGRGGARCCRRPVQARGPDRTQAKKELMQR